MALRFSQRTGYTPFTKELQIASIDNELLNGLWNCIKTFVLEKLEDEYRDTKQQERKFFLNSIWHLFFKKAIDVMPARYVDSVAEIRRFFFSCKWFEVYDFLEFVISLAEDELLNPYLNEDEIINQINAVLKREFAGYTTIDSLFVPITNENEIAEIEEALDHTNNFTPLINSNVHLADALNKLSDRISPDYRNSIKESISAVESCVKVFSSNNKDSLGGAIDRIKGKLKIHPSLERGFKQLYGYTSDSDGIRHALMEDSNCDFEDAKYMLVSCSAFINYLVIKAKKAGINL